MKLKNNGFVETSFVSNEILIRHFTRLPVVRPFYSAVNNALFAVIIVMLTFESLPLNKIQKNKFVFFTRIFRESSTLKGVQTSTMILTKLVYSFFIDQSSNLHLIDR